MHHLTKPLSMIKAVEPLVASRILSTYHMPRLTLSSEALPVFKSVKKMSPDDKLIFVEAMQMRLQNATAVPYGIRKARIWREMYYVKKVPGLRRIRLFIQKQS